MRHQTLRGSTPLCLLHVDTAEHISFRTTMDEYPDGSVGLAPGCQRQIQCWQERSVCDLELQSHGLVSSLVRNCLDSLNHVLREHGVGADALSKTDRNALQRSLSLLRLWAKGHGALTGDLDALLDRSKSLRQTTLAVLHPLCCTLAKGLFHFSLLNSGTNRFRATAAI